MSVALDKHLSSLFTMCMEAPSLDLKHRGRSNPPLFYPVLVITELEGTLPSSSHTPIHPSFTPLYPFAHIVEEPGDSGAMERLLKILVILHIKIPF